MEKNLGISTITSLHPSKLHLNTGYAPPTHTGSLCPGLGTHHFYFKDRKNVKFQDIFQDIRVTKNVFFVISGAYNFGTFRVEAKITIQRHEVVYWLSSERKMIDLE